MPLFGQKSVMALLEQPMHQRREYQVMKRAQSSLLPPAVGEQLNGTDFPSSSLPLSAELSTAPGTAPSTYEAARLALVRMEASLKRVCEYSPDDFSRANKNGLNPWLLCALHYHNFQRALQQFLQKNHEHPLFLTYRQYLYDFLKVLTKQVELLEGQYNAINQKEGLNAILSKALSFLWLVDKVDQKVIVHREFRGAERQFSSIFFPVTYLMDYPSNFLILRFRSGFKKIPKVDDLWISFFNSLAQGFSTTMDYLNLSESIPSIQPQIPAIPALKEETLAFFLNQTPYWLWQNACDKAVQPNNLKGTHWQPHLIPLALLLKNEPSLKKTLDRFCEVMVMPIASLWKEELVTESLAGLGNELNRLRKQEVFVSNPELAYRLYYFVASFFLSSEFQGQSLSFLINPFLEKTLTRRKLGLQLPLEKEAVRMRFFMQRKRRALPPKNASFFEVLDFYARIAVSEPWWAFCQYMAPFIKQRNAVLKTYHEACCALATILTSDIPKGVTSTAEVIWELRSLIADEVATSVAHDTPYNGSGMMFFLRGKQIEIKGKKLKGDVFYQKLFWPEGVWALERLRIIVQHLKSRRFALLPDEFRITHRASYENKRFINAIPDEHELYEVIRLFYGRVFEKQPSDPLLQDVQIITPIQIIAIEPEKYINKSACQFITDCVFPLIKIVKKTNIANDACYGMNTPQQRNQLIQFLYAILSPKKVSDDLCIEEIRKVSAIIMNQGNGQADQIVRIVLWQLLDPGQTYEAFKASFGPYLQPLSQQIVACVHQRISDPTDVKGAAYFGKGVHGLAVATEGVNRRLLPLRLSALHLNPH